MRRPRLGLAARAGIGPWVGMVAAAVAAAGSRDGERSSWVRRRTHCSREQRQGRVCRPHALCWPAHLADCR